MAKYIVTGGAGFIGSNIVEELVKRGEHVKVIDNLSTGKKENITPLLDKIEFVEGSITDLDLLKTEFEGYDYVLHQAAIPSVPRSVEDPLTTNEANVTGTLNALIAARDSGIKRFVFASSFSVYGDTPTLPKREEMTPKPLSPYAISKLTGEYYCRVFYTLYGFETVALRYSNIFGPRQDPASQYSAVIPKFISAMYNDEQPEIYGDGEQTRDFTYVENVVHANILACTAEKAAGEVINTACGEKTTVNQLVENLNEILEKSINPIHSDPRPGDIKHSLADISKAETILGYKPKVYFKDGLKKTVGWFKSNG